MYNINRSKRGTKNRFIMKYLDYKKVMIRLGVVSILCAMPMFITCGQNTATGEFTVTEIQSSGRNTYIVGKDSKKEVKTSGNILEWFDESISVDNAYTQIKGNSDETVSKQFVAEIKHDGKSYQLTVLSGMKLKYKLTGENAVILFDESYCLPKEK